jgi:tetraacyldisaccharide 4'-kinase
VLVNHERPVFRDFLLPLGNLRECRRNINRADAVIVTKCPPDMTTGQQDAFTAKLNLRHEQPVFFTSYRYGSLLPVFEGKAPVIDQNKEGKSKPSVLLVTGIADGRSLKMYLNQFMTIRAEMRFPDHHFYSINDIHAMEKRFIELPAERKIILTTEKDAVKLREMAGELQKMLAFLYFIPVEAKFLDEDGTKFDAMVRHMFHEKSKKQKLLS